MLNRPYAAVVRGEDVLFTETHNHSLRIADRNGNVNAAKPPFPSLRLRRGWPHPARLPRLRLRLAGRFWPIRHATQLRQGLPKTREYRQSTLTLPL